MAEIHITLFSAIKYLPLHLKGTAFFNLVGCWKFAMFNAHIELYKVQSAIIYSIQKNTYKYI